MVEIVNNAVCGGVAGKRQGKVKGVVIHNDGGNMTAKQYVQWLKGHNLANGFAHYYIDRFTIARTENTYNMAWHTANADGNANYIGYEVCQSVGASDKDFLANEQMTFKQVAEDLKYYGLEANRNTVRLHKEFSATSCPHRSWDMHGKSTNAVKDYFISQIKKYMNGETKPVAKQVIYQTTPGRYRALKTDDLYLEKELKTKSAWKIKEGQEWYLEDIVMVGKYSRAKIRLNNDIRYCTMRDDYWKLISKTEAKKIK